MFLKKELLYTLKEKRMELKKEINDTVHITDSVSFEIKVIKHDVTSITKLVTEFDKIMRNIIIIIVLFFLITAIQLAFFADKILFNILIFVPIGLLTFISIFYSLLVSDNGKKEIVEISQLIERIKDNIQETTDKETRKLEEKEYIQTIKEDTIVKIGKLEKIKKLIDIESYLVSTVFIFLISILFALVSDITSQRLAYAFSMGGLWLTVAIVLTWRNLPNIKSILEKQLGEER